MAAEEARSTESNIDRYIRRAFFAQVNRVFGVQVYAALRSDLSDARQQVNNKNSIRAVGKCFARLTNFELKEDGYRPAAIASTGYRANVIGARPDGVATIVGVIHPLPCDLTYEMTFEVESDDKLYDLWAIWVAARVNASLDFIVRYYNTDYTINVQLDNSLGEADFGSAGDIERTDVGRVVGSLRVSGYTTSVADPHHVPIILESDVSTNLKP